MPYSHYTYGHLAYNRKGQQFYYTHINFNLPKQKPIEKRTPCCEKRDLSSLAVGIFFYQL